MGYKSFSKIENIVSGLEIYALYFINYNIGRLMLNFTLPYVL